MQIEVVEFMILDDCERKIVRDCMHCCNPVNLTEDEQKVRNRLCDEKKYDEYYVLDQVLPYLEWLLVLYHEQLRVARERKFEAKEWEVVISSREEMIPKVEEVRKMFTEFVLATGE